MALPALSGASNPDDAAIRSAVSQPTDMPSLAPPSQSSAVGDMGQTQNQAAVSNAIQDAPDTGARPPSLWRGILQGALAGLANSAKAKTFAGGLAAGAQGEEVQQQQNRENMLRQQQMNSQQAQAAYYVAETNKLALQLAQANPDSPEHHALLAEQNQQRNDEMIRNGGAKILSSFPNLHDAQQFGLSANASGPADGTYIGAITGPDGTTQYGVIRSNNQPIAQDMTIPVVGADGKMTTQLIPAGSMTYQQVAALAYEHEKQRGDLGYQQTLSNLGVKAKVEESAQTGETAKNVAEANKANAEAVSTTSLQKPDATGFTPNVSAVGGPKAYVATQKAFKKNADDLAQTEQGYQQFQSILSDINSGNFTGAQSVVGLFNAIGISAEPLKGKGFRITGNTIEEHANARGMLEGAYQKFLHMKEGDVITPDMFKNYASIATRAREDKYVAVINEAHNEGLNADFLLPAGNGQKIDPSTARIFLRLTGGDMKKAQAAAAAKGWTS